MENNSNTSQNNNENKNKPLLYVIIALLFIIILLLLGRCVFVEKHVVVQPAPVVVQTPPAVPYEPTPPAAVTGEKYNWEMKTSATYDGKVTEYNEIRCLDEMEAEANQKTMSGAELPVGDKSNFTFNDGECKTSGKTENEVITYISDCVNGEKTVVTMKAGKDYSEMTSESTLNGVKTGSNKTTRRRLGKC